MIGHSTYVCVCVCVLSLLDCYFKPRIFPYDGNGSTIDHAFCLLEIQNLELQLCCNT